MAALWILITLATLAVPSPAVAAQDSPLQSVLDSTSAALDIPGATGAVIFANGSMWKGASGRAGPNSPTTPATAFELGSIAKVYTATVVLNSWQKGGLICKTD